MEIGEGEQVCEQSHGVVSEGEGMDEEVKRGRGASRNRRSRKV